MGPFSRQSVSLDRCEDVFALRVEGVSKSFGSDRALDGVSFEITRGSFLSIFGPNGAGKTTLLRILAMLSRPTSGSLELLGTDAGQDPDGARARLGLVSHESMVYGDLTARENLLLAARLYGVEDAQRRVDDLLESVELSHRSLDQARTFSRGMMQRLSIARALVHDPEIVFLDEPYSGLDPRAIEIFDALLDSIRADRTFVMVSHDLRKGYDSCTHVLMLVRGRRALFSSKDEISFDDFSQQYRKVVGMGVS